MKAVILAGGKGTRLIEKTKFIPKPMVKIGSKPIIWHIVKQLSMYGIKEFIIASGYKSEVIESFFKKEKSLKNLKILVKKTGINSMTGYRLKMLEKYLNETFLVTYGDGISNININKLIKFHKKKQGLITLTTVKPPPRWGYVLIDKKSKVSSFKEKALSKENLINAGYMIMEKKIFRYLLKNKSEILESDLLPKIIKKKKLYAYYHSSYWQCMDTLRENLILNKLWKTNKAPWKNW